MIRFQPVKLGLAIAIAVLATCSPKIDQRGFYKDGDWKSKIVAGQTTKDQVLAEFGSPSAQSTFGDETWYYISARQETVAFLKPEIAEQDVLRLEFDPSGVVSRVEAYNKENAKDFSLVKRTTPTEGHSMGVVEQFLGNIGRFNSPAGAGDSSAPGRQPGGR